MPSLRRSAPRLGALAAAVLLGAAPAFAQDMPGMPGMAGTSPTWTATVDAQAVVDGNLQQRKFRDFHQVEVPNWFMLHAMRGAGRGSLMLRAMFSLEPFTLRKLGSAEVFQTGETYKGLPLVDYQHPHDFVMAGGAAYEWPAMERTRVRLEADLVGEPALGPPAFMHRPSAEANPTAPLGHHHLDSTHITHGVLTAGVVHGGITLEASAFHGREPDEHRVQVEFGPIDSYSARLSWRRGRWIGQLSGGHLKFPDATEFTDLDRVTASVSYSGQLRRRPLEGLFAVGVNRESRLQLTSPAWLAEATWRVTPGDLAYARAELVDQDILTAGGYDPPDFLHPHVLSRVGALTMGYERDVARGAAGHVGVGGDVIVYRTPANLLFAYGHPFSAHVFLRFRFGASTSAH